MRGSSSSGASPARRTERVPVALEAPRTDYAGRGDMARARDRVPSRNLRCAGPLISLSTSEATMGLLDQIIGGVLGSRGRGGGLGGAIGGPGGMSPLMMALMALLASRATGNDGGLGGVLGNVLGGGQPGGAHSGGGLSGEALRDMVRGGPAA